LDPIDDAMTGVGNTLGGLRDLVDHALTNVLGALVIGASICLHPDLLSARLGTGQAHDEFQQLLDGKQIGEEDGVIR